MKKKLFPNKRHFHFVGIGGVGMSALAKTLNHLGFKVSGTDQKEGSCFEKMRMAGIRVFSGHDGKLDPTIDALVYSTAISDSNLEVRQARQLGIPLMHRSEVLAELLNKRPSMGITGTHGKTTTTAMISFLAEKIGWKPTCLIGGILLNHDDNVLLGSDDLYIAEVDESDKSHRRYEPLYSLITNVEKEHLDHYKDFEEIKACFKDYGSQTREGGLLLINHDDEELLKLFTDYSKPLITYGFSHQADFWAHDIHLDSKSSEYSLYRSQKKLGRIKLGMPGLHNVSNSIAALALVIAFGSSPDEVIARMADFKGTGRRLEVKLETSDLLVVDDYAHHPTEIQASLRALKSYGKKVTAVFQPHRFSRIRNMLEEFGSSFADADRIVVTDIYGAGEMNNEKISAREMLKTIRRHGHNNASFIEKNNLLNALKPSEAPEGELFAFMGAGDISEIADAFAVRFRT